jgi:chorismate mutase|mmetsp:Transcript_3850/g.11123  ORF Transcript_3850/g.11123 Transcript_3850/m.11123 type:complete len:287 (-) Transcript_3850:49-909(-)
MAANTANVLDPAKALDLNNIRATLQRMEDSIIFSLIERSQFSQNMAVYEPDCDQLGEFKLHQLKSSGSNGCLGDWFIYQTECLHSQVRRYQHPTEYPFFEPLPEASLGSTSGSRTERTDRVLAPVPAKAIVNRRLLHIYRAQMVPAICLAGDCGNHGSTAVQDVHCLQTMATRIYYGLFVAESKFRSETEKATRLIKAGDREGIMEFITKRDVEERNIQRVILKARTFSQNIAAAEAGQLAPAPSSETTHKIDPEYIGTVFKDFLMPLTRDVEVEYLLQRLDHEVK